MGKKIPLIHRFTIVIFALTIILNIIVWNSTAFCDWYIKTFYWLTLNIYGRITSIFPFSVGEVMIVLGIIMILILLVSLVGLLVCGIRKLVCKKLWTKVWKICRVYQNIFLLILSIVCLVMTLNCFVLYHSTGFADKYMEVKEEYSLEEIRALRNHVVERCNELSKLIDRDENGNAIYKGDMKKEAIKAMKKLGEEYSQLSGFYPNPKTIGFSGFMSQQYVTGVFFPFSMEANVNGVMYICNYPATLCHELAHVKGYIYEDEANFIGYLACISSDDIFFQYSGYLSVLFYLDDDYYFAVTDVEEYFEQVAIDDRVYEDAIFLSEEAWEEVEEDAVIDTEIVEDISDAATDTSLKLNGVKEGSLSYSMVVKLMLAYEEAKKNE